MLLGTTIFYFFVELLLCLCHSLIDNDTPIHIPDKPLRLQPLYIKIYVSLLSSSYLITILLFVTSFALIVLIGIANPVAMSSYSSDKCSDRMLNHAFGRYADRAIVLIILSALIFTLISAITVFNTLAVLSVTGLRPAFMRDKLMFT